MGLVPRPADSSAAFQLTPLSDLRKRVIWGQLLCHSVMSCKGFPVVEEERKNEREREREREREEVGRRLVGIQSSLLLNVICAFLISTVDHNNLLYC